MEPEILAYPNRFSVSRYSGRNLAGMKDFGTYLEKNRAWFGWWHRSKLEVFLDILWDVFRMWSYPPDIQPLLVVSTRRPKRVLLLTTGTEQDIYRVVLDLKCRGPILLRIHVGLETTHLVEKLDSWSSAPVDEFLREGRHIALMMPKPLPILAEVIDDMENVL